MARAGFSSANFLSVSSPTGILALQGSVFTIAAWMFSGSLPDAKIVGLYNGTDGYGLLVRSTSVVAGFVADGTADSANSGAILTTGTWHHLAGVKNGTGADAMKTYFDGVEVASITSNRTVSYAATIPFIWGRRSGTAEQYTNGQLARSVVWQAALTAAEVAAMAKGASPLSVRPASMAWYEGWGVGAGDEPDLQPVTANQTLAESGTVTVTDHAPVCPPFPVAV